jgi:hypothetical protein
MAAATCVATHSMIWVSHYAAGLCWIEIDPDVRSYIDGLSTAGERFIFPLTYRVHRRVLQRELSGNDSQWRDTARFPNDGSDNDV